MAAISAYATRVRGSRWDSHTWQIVFLLMLVAVGVIVGLATSEVPLKILFGAIAGIIVFVLIYRNLYFGICLYFIFNLTLPQAGPGLDLGIQVAVVGETRGLHFNLHEIAMTMVLICWVIQILQGKASWRERNPIVVPIILYVLSNILACFIGTINGASFLIMIFRFVRTVFFVYIIFVLINNLKTRRQFEILILILLICSTLVATYGITQKVIGQTNTEKIAKQVFSKLGVPDSVNYVAGEGEGQAYRVNSTFLHPNVLGAYMVLALPFFISLLWFFRKRWQRLLLLGGLGINLGCLYLTGSRAAWIAMGVIIGIYAIYAIFDGRMVLLAVAIMLVILMLFVLISPPDFIKKRTVSFSAQEAAKARLSQYRTAGDFFWENPVFGIGMGMEGKRVEANRIRTQWAAVENVYLTLLVSHGLVGLAAFLLVLIYFWGMLCFARAGSKDDPFIRYTSEALILGMVGIAVSSMFGAWLIFAIPMYTMFCFFLGFGASLYGLYRRDHQGSGKGGEPPAFPLSPDEENGSKGPWEPAAI